jgi:hypothetical protein
MIRPEIRDWLGPETRIGIEPIVAHGGMDAQALRFEGDIGHRKLGIDRADQFHTGLGIGCRIDRSFSEPFSGIGVCFPGPGAAVLTCELAWMSWPAIHLGELNQIKYFSREAAIAEL